MDWDEVRSAWKDQRGVEAATPRLGPPGGERALWRIIRRRDLGETLVGLVLLPVFGVWALTAGAKDRWVEAAFAGLLVVSISYIIVRLSRARKQIPTPDPGASVREFLQAELAAVQTQSRLLRNVGLWYLAPLGVGVIGLVASSRGFDGFSLLYALFVIALYVGIAWLNRTALALKVDPVRTEIELQLAELEAHAQLGMGPDTGEQA